MSQELRQCSKCKKYKSLDDYRPDRKLCNQCLEEKAIYRENHREELREKSKQDYQNNREEKLEKRRAYVSANPEKVLQQKKEYRERCRERIKEQRKEYYQEHREERLENNKQYQKQTIQCPVCNCQVRKYKFSIHEQTKKHMNNLNKTETE